jgi:hypothetical protein
MNTDKSTVHFDEMTSTFIIRIFGRTTENQVVALFQAYEEYVDKIVKNSRFNIIINVDNEAHSSIFVLKRIRKLLENQKRKDKIANIVAVNENKIVVDMRNESSESKLLPFFISEKDAIQFLMHKKLSD